MLGDNLQPRHSEYVFTELLVDCFYHHLLAPGCSGYCCPVDVFHM